MQIIYDTLLLELPYEVLSVQSIRLQGSLNEHGVAEIDFQCKEEDAKNIVLRSMETDKITISENNNRIFTGVLSSIKEKRYKGKTCIRTVWKTATANMDITKRKLAVTGEDLRFEDILTRITGNYQAGFIDGLHANAMLPGFVLQYDETDWEFMKRLAAMQGGVLVPDYTSPKGTFFYGIRDRKPEPIEDMDGKRETQIDYASYDKKEARGELAFIQDCYHFTVTSQKHYELGQSVTYGYVDGLIESIDIYGDAGILVKKYGIVTKGGVQSASGINPAYSGLHLPAIVSEVKGNEIRVDFEIDQMAGGQKRYFPYAVESSAWYCMPESGSKVHIYLPENDETKAYAVHSMRNTTAGAKNEQATQNPGVKSFTHPSGSSMQMDAGSLTLNSDATGQAQAVLGSDGTLGLRAKKITIKAAGKVSIGAGEVNTENIAITSGADISLLSEQGAFAYIEQQTYLQGQNIQYTAKIHDEMTLPDAILNRNEGIAEKIADVNHGAKQVQLQKVQESKSKFGMGVFAMVAGAVAIAAVAVCTCGVGLIAVGAVAGGTAIVCGAAMAAEGVSDYKKTMESGDYSKSFNFIRDTIFQGNQTLYDIVTYGSVLICGIVVATATGGGGLEALKTVLARTGTEMGIDTAMSMAMDYIDDGSINNGWESYFKNMCTTGCTAGLSMGAMDKFKQLEKAGKYSCEEIGKMRLATDMALDTLVSVATTGDADLAQIYLRNYLSNKLCLSDPVDGATGSLYIPATDMRVPDFYEDYCITRKYESINRRTGMLGYGWTCSLESLLSERSGYCMILCTDGHVESFHKRAGSWHNDKGNSERMQLLEYADEWRLYDAAERMQYVYDRSGRLQEIIERHGKSSKYLYENGVLCAVTTFAGTRIEVTIRDGRLAELRDVLGRTVTYTYDRKRLVCINQNGRGLTRYTYDKSGHIVEITDQNNKKYTRNTFDAKGRVTRQDYPDGTCCEISYDQKEKSVSFFYPETGGRETTYYNADMLVTRLEYQDGTCEEYGYDEWQNRILEKDRNGGVTTREYNVRGEKTKETLPNGLVRSFAYDDRGNLTESTDTAGGCIRYTYDEQNHLIQKSELVSTEPQKWSHEKYGYDHLGRMLWQEDGCGNRRSYEYDSPEAFRPSLETSPEGYEFFYTYDAAGRRTGTETAKNRIQFSYNSLHYLNHVTDGEGNELHEERDNLGSLTRHYSHRQYRRRRGYSYEYDHFDRLVKLTDPLGRVKRLTRNGQGSVVYESMLETPAGVPKAQKENGIRSLYDANDHATRILCPDGGSWERTYDAKGNLIYEKAPGENSRGRCYTYDSQDRLLLVEWEDGAVEKSYRYDLKGQLVEEENALGEKTLYAYDLSGRRTGMWKQMGEESYQATVYRYDAAGNVTEERRGSRAVGAYEEPRQFLAIRKTYDRENRLIQVEDGTGARVLYTYDIMNNRTGEESFTEEKKSRRVHYTYDRAGRLVQKEVETDGSFEVEKSVTSYTYDQDHNLLSVILPEGGTIRWLYDEANRPVCRLEEDKQHGISRAFVYRYGDACPLPMEELYPQENPVKKHNALFMGCEGLEDYTSEQTLQALCKERPQKVLYYHGKKAEGIYRSLEAVYHDLKVFVPEAEKAIAYGEEGSDYLVKEYRYDFRGNLLRETDSFGNVRSYVYDQSGQLVKIQEPSGNESVFTYDMLGRLTAKTNGEGEREYRLTYDALGRVSTHTDGEGNTTAYTYHPSGGVEKVTGPDQIVDSHTEYDIWGRPERITDGMGNVTRYEKDSWGRVTGVLLPDGGREQYHYDYAGNVTIAVDALGNETHFAYRGDSRLESIRRADQTVRYFGYDKEGRCSLRLDENRNLIRTRYNMDANPVDVAGSRGADLQALLRGELPQAEPELRSLYTYDERGFFISASEGGTVYHYTRDAEGRVLKKSAWGQTLYENCYDADGRLSKLVTGAGTTTYHYDRAGRLAKVISDSGVSAEYRYNRNDMQTEVRYGNGLQTAYTYDERNRLVGMCSGFEGQTPLLQSAYTYDKNGNRITKEEQFQCGVGTQPFSLHTEYTYDNMSRLTGETRNGETTGYGYDLAGNRTTKTAQGRTESYLYNSRNQLTELKRAEQTIRYRYDKAGSLVEEKHCTAEGLEIKNLTYAYDTYNRNTSVNGADFTQKNHYDAEGYRYALEENGKVTNFAYRGGLLVSELDAEKSCSKGYVLGNEYVGQSRVSQLNGKLAEDSYYVTDEQESIRYVLSQDGEVQNCYQYGAFGEALLTEESTPNRLRYNAQIEDDLTGLYYLRARYFNPTTGRFTQEDVIYNDGLNLYAYCNSNPVMYCDPSGYEGEKLDWNQFQSMNAGKYDNAGMSDAWSLYKADNGYEHYLHRPNLRSDTVDGIVLGRGANGTFYDANTFEIIEGQVDIGHQPGKEYWRCRDAAELLGWSQSQFNDYMNHDPKKFYQFESHESNISHRYEDKSKDISSEIEAMKKYEKEKGSKESKNKCTKK